jgi:peptidoglycan/xylan/chitin deacetylase (PgdA/CDA1 family)
LSPTSQALGRELCAVALRASGIPLLIRHLWARRRATVVNYHDTKPDVLDRHLSYLKRHYNVITLGRLVDAIRSGTWTQLPVRSLVVTLDDGHRGNRALLPIFLKHGVTPTIYLVSGVAGTTRRFWFKHPGVVSEPLKSVENRERLRILQRQHGFIQTADSPPAEAQGLSLADIDAMKPYVDFGSHTRFHPVLTTCSPDELSEEISGSKSEVEALTASPCHHFCFPSGDYDDRVLRSVRAAGFHSARTIDLGWNGPDTDPYRLKVVGISDDASVNILIAQLSNAASFSRRAIRGEWLGRHRRGHVRNQSSNGTPGGGIAPWGRNRPHEEPARDA